MRLVTARFVAQAVAVAARLGVADAIGDGEATTATLAEATGAEPAMLERLLAALADFDLFRVGRHGWALSEAGQRLRAGVAGSVRDMVLFFATPEHYAAWGGLETAVRSGESGFRAVFGTDLWHFMADNPGLARVFDAAMATTTAAKRAAIVASYDFAAFATLADIGGGSGALLCAILKDVPGLRGILFDRPDVIERARETIAAEGCADRCQAVGGSFFERVPPGADGYLMASILHDWDDARGAAILAVVRAAMPAHGRLLVCERILAPPGSAPDPGRVMDLEMMVMNEGGRERTAEEFAALFARAGLRLVRILRIPGMHALMETTLA
jgi:hypothetical protein